MKDADLANMLRGMARHCGMSLRHGMNRGCSVNHQEHLALEEAAHRLAQLGAPARLLSFEEIQQLPEYAIVWEEWRGLPEEYRPSDWGIAPVARIGGGLAGNGIITFIDPGMMDGNEDDGQSRWWTNVPTPEQRRATPWTQAE